MNMVNSRFLGFLPAICLTSACVISSLPGKGDAGGPKNGTGDTTSGGDLLRGTEEVGAGASDLRDARVSDKVLPVDAGLWGEVASDSRIGGESDAPVSMPMDSALISALDALHGDHPLADAPDTSGGRDAGAGGTGVANAPHGIFEVRYVTGESAATSFADITGLVRDGAPVQLVLWEKKKTEGDCSIYTPRIPFCTSCSSPRMCAADNVCRLPPTSLPVGKVTLTGLNSPSGANPFELAPVTSTTGTYYQCAENLPLPPCTVGGAIALDATGEGQFPAFNIAARCIAPLVVTNTECMIESGRDFALTWLPGTVADARVGFELDLSHHGGTRGRLVCDTADSGSLRVPGALIKSLMDLGVTGFPKAEIKRVFTNQSAVGSGQVELRLRSDREFLVDIPGLQSCNINAECVAPETCQYPAMMCGISCKTNADCPSGKTCLSTTKICG